MVRAWYMDDDTTTDQRQPHERNPSVPVDLDYLQNLGVLYFKINGESFENNEEVEKIKQDRGYTYEDRIQCCPEKLPNYEQKIKSFFEEHLHSDEEIRLCCDGSGYFDVRDREDQWIRIELVKGDMIILPAGIYHRFTLDANNYIEARRYFVGEPVWTPHNRPGADDRAERQEYLKSLQCA